MKPVRTLILVAGDEDARFLLNEGVGKGLSEVAGTSIGQYADATAEYADRPGRSGMGRGTGAMQAFDPHQSVAEQHRARFARHVVEALAQEWASAAPDRLVIAASPKMLGELRRVMPDRLARAVTAELHKDLVKVPVHDLPGHLSSVIAV